MESIGMIFLWPVKYVYDEICFQSYEFLSKYDLYPYLWKEIARVLENSYSNIHTLKKVH